jgi:hypothetical protein
MATCDLGHEHDDIPEPAPVIIEADPGTNENDVKIAEVEAAARIAADKEWTKQEGLRLESEVEGLRGEIRGMRETLDRLAPPEPEPGPAPEIVPVPVPDPEPEPVPAPPETKPETGEKKSGGGWWSGYSG